MQTYHLCYIMTSGIALLSSEGTIIYQTLCFCIALSIHIELRLSWGITRKIKLAGSSFPLILFALLNVIGHKSQTVSCVLSFLPTRNQKSLFLRILKIYCTI